ncbi:beta-lactamase-like protein [Diaporthe sp. PMI_573]|nr:beta-lactamase-like protein [Diaporthaceae sp. PMI_573]
MALSSKPKGFYSSGFWADYLATQRSKLPTLPDIDDGFSHRVIRFLGGNPGDMQLQGTNTYLVGTGRSRILIDTGEGFPQWATNLTVYLDSHDIEISQVLLTHWHADHTGGVDDLLAYDPSITVHKNRPNKGQLAIADGQIFRTQGATLRAVVTPGHSNDHTCFVLVEENALFTGDNVLGHGYSVAEDLGAYTTSLRRMADLGCSTGYPGHGAVIGDLPQKLARYISQRDARERQVYATLAKETSLGSSRVTGGSIHGNSLDNMVSYTHGLSVADICLILYGKAVRDPATFESALKPLMSQVLFMLEEQGRVGFKLAGLDKETRYWFARDVACN